LSSTASPCGAFELALAAAVRIAQLSSGATHTAVGGPTTLPGTGTVAVIFSASSLRSIVVIVSGVAAEAAVRLPCASSAECSPLIEMMTSTRRRRQGDCKQRGHHHGPALGATHFHHRFLSLPSALRLK
jgi:hypothetical protein